MRTKTNDRKRKIIRWILSVSLVLTIIVGVFAIYVSDYYRADMDAIEAFASQGNIDQTTLYDGSIVFSA